MGPGPGLWGVWGGVRGRELGADLASGISSNLDFLIIGEKPSPSKIAKAQNAGVQILEEAAYLEMIQGA